MIRREPAFVSVEFSLEEHSSRAKWDLTPGPSGSLIIGTLPMPGNKLQPPPEDDSTRPEGPSPGGSLRFVPNHRVHLHPYGNPLASFASMHVFQTVVFIQLQA